MYNYCLFLSATSNSILIPLFWTGGHSYFKSNLVNEPDELSTGLFEAIVYGSVPYNVRITLEGEQVIHYSCTCPYDYGPVCKHVVSLMYYLRRNLEVGLQSKSQKSSKRKTISQQIDELLAKISNDDLVSFSKDLALKDKKYRRKLTNAFIHLNQDGSKAFYADQIQNILNAASGEFGIIGWDEVYTVAHQVHDLLDTAETQVGKGHYKSALYICFAVMEELVEVFEYLDDSNGDISDCVYRASEIIHTIASESLPESIRKRLLEECFSAITKGTFSGWDWNLYMLKALAKLYETEEEAEHILGLIDTAKLSDYEMSNAQRIQLQIIEDLKGEEEASQFMTKYLSNPEIRTAVIQKAIEIKQYEQAKTIAKDGIEYDKKDRPGLIYDWYRHLLNIAKLLHKESPGQKNRENIIEYARILFLNSINEKQPYYDLLREHVPANRWTDFVEDLISDIKKRNRWLDFDLIAQIYINEQWWDRLFEWVTEKPTLENIEDYQQYLAKDYAPEIADLYEQEILSLLKHNTGRKYYRKVCRFIRKMNNLGSQKKAQQLVKKIKATYPNRPALIDELNKISL